MLIAGSGRSGTTWVLDVIATTFQLRPVFEPLHPTAVKGAEPYAWRYLPADEDIPGMAQFVGDAFAGRISTLWTDFRVHPRSIFPYLHDLRDLASWNLLRHDWMTAIRQYRACRTWRTRQRVIVKCIRANLLLGWIAKRFHAKVVLLVRHPGAVVESKLRLAGISWDPTEMLGVYRRDDRIQELRGGLYWDLLHRDLTPAQALTLLWCIENQGPMAEASGNAYLLVHYEDLVDHGAPAWDRIAHYLGLRSDAWDHALLARPSQQASTVWQGQDAVRSHANWMRRISDDTLQQIEAMLDATGEVVYRAREARPATSSPQADSGTLEPAHGGDERTHPEPTAHQETSLVH
jgi:hypothetical protein